MLDQAQELGDKAEQVSSLWSTVQGFLGSNTTLLVVLALIASGFFVYWMATKIKAYPRGRLPEGRPRMIPFAILFKVRELGGVVFRFLSTPIGQIVCVALIVAGAYLYGQHEGKQEVRQAWAAANQRAKQEKLEFEKLMQDRLDKIESEKSAALEKQQEEFLKKIADYEAELKKRPDARCTLNGADLKRLRNIR